VVQQAAAVSSHSSKVGPVEPSQPVTEGGRATIELRLREVDQLFDVLDPSPFHEKELDRRAEDYIVESVRELPSRAGPTALVIYVDHDPKAARDDQDQRAIGDAIRAHFARRSRLLWRQLRQLIRRGVISLAIGVAFLAAVFGIAEAVTRLWGESTLATLLHESLLIGGWVAMWRPLEIFLYDWWPIVGERRIHQRLSRIDVRVVYDESN
jgi:hypothetical protein